MTLKELITKHKILQNVMCGVYIGDGWVDIVDQLTTELVNYASINKLDLTVDQVKEKFGTLRYYVNTYDDTISMLISDAEKLSAKTCEECGQPGKMRGKSWLYTACDSCHKARQSK